jgi:hypothetical protein
LDDIFLPIVTKIRTIKKVFIIDEGDIKTFVEIIKFATPEIDGIFNLIFTSTQVFTAEICELIKQNSPDVIINYSSISDNEFPHFKKKVINIKDGRLYFLKTDFYYWNQRAIDSLSSMIDLKKLEIFYNSKDELNNDSIIDVLNYGIFNFTDDYNEMYSISIFKNCNLYDINKNDPNDTENSISILGLSTLFSSSSYSMNNKTNPNNYFARDDKKVIILGDSNNLESILYFWNERALYFSNNIAFITSENQIKQSTLDEFQYVVNFRDEESLSELQKCNDKIIELEKKYYFDGRHRDWENFSHYSYARKNVDSIEINHPVEKSFANFGVQNVMLEISGVNECFLPIHHKYSELFKKGFSNFQEYSFTSNCENSISIYKNYFNIDFSHSNLYALIHHPSKMDILATFQDINNIKLEETKKTKLFNNLYNSIKDKEIVKLLRNRSYFDLLVSMSPKRMSTIIDKIRTLSPDAEVDQIKSYLENVVTLKSDVICTFNDLKSKFSGDKKILLNNIEKLIHNNVLIQGKKFSCPICDSLLWYSTDNIKNNLNCYCCNNQIRLPIVDKGVVIPDSVKLNEIFIESIDQGQLTMLLVNEILNDQNLRNKKLYYNYNIFQNDELLTDIDILAILNSLVGFIEVKSNRKFDISQSIKLIETASRLEVDFLIFASLYPSNHESISSFVTEIKDYDDKSIIILTGDTLFSEKKININDLMNKGIVIK